MVSDSQIINKLILIGNGFDLAHGLKTSFSHFLDDYEDTVIGNLTNSKEYSDEFIICKINSNYTVDDVLKAIVGVPGDKLKFLKKRKIISLYSQSELFLNITRSNAKKKWVDIEVEFFDFISNPNEPQDVTKIIKANAHFTVLRNYLIKYLEKEVSRNKPPIEYDLFHQFIEKIQIKDCIQKSIEQNSPPSNVHFLNFNYTNTLEKYLTEFKSLRPDITFDNNYIHGALNVNSVNKRPPIFGFGDEIDKKYQNFEERRDNHAFEHMKSFKYLEGINYRQMLEFVDSNLFQVTIFGHSCGISDRTLLKTIFEHPNCISIKPYYYEGRNEKNDFTEKTYAISRCFEDKKLLRAKVVNFEYCSPMAQPSESE